MIEILKENWKLILEVVVLLASIIFFIVKKKPVKVIDSLKTAIMRILPILINEAEEKFGAGNGAEKNKFVLQSVIDDLKVTQPGVDVNFYLPFIRKFIEDILSTPQKKGE